MYLISEFKISRKAKALLQKAVAIFALPEAEKLLAAHDAVQRTLAAKDAAAVLREVGLHFGNERHEGVLPRVVYRAEDDTSG